MTGNVLGGAVVGGMIGHDSTASSVIVASYSTAVVTSPNHQRAGFAGWSGDGSSIRTSYSTGTVPGSDGSHRAPAPSSQATGITTLVPKPEVRAMVQIGVEHTDEPV